VNFAAAKSHCESFNTVLCSVAQLEAGAGTGTGCQHNWRMNWARDPCGPPIVYNTHSIVGSSTCSYTLTTCPPGTFASGTGSCESMTNSSCPSGEAYSSASANYIRDGLDIGSTNSSLIGATQDDGICAACIPGMFKPFDRAGRCKTCPEGFFTNQRSSTFCHTCPEGFYNNVKGNSKCTACLAGRYSDQSTQSFSSSCKGCPAGKYAPSTNSISCFDCPPGTNNKDTQGTTAEHDEQSDCQNCSIGKYSEFLGHGMECFECLSAKVSGTLECGGCSPGTYINKTASAEESSCRLCPKGYYTNDRDLKACYVCPLGYYSSEKRPFLNCQSCPRGTFGHSEAAISKSVGCNNCTRGMYSELEALTREEQCKGCPKGKWNANVGVTKESACINCVTGTYGQDNKGAKSPTSCTPCVKGKYLDVVGAFGSQSCQVCPSGFVQNFTGRAFCLPCTPGSFTVGKGMAECIPCGAGRSSATVARTEMCDVCTKGRHQPDTGTTSCLKCIPGTYQSNLQQIKCKVCRIGRASSVIARENECDVCVKGRHQPNNGTTACLDCIPGKYQSETGQSNCNNCEIGRASSAVARGTFCDVCTVGRKQPNQGTTDCLDCIPGTYSMYEKQRECKICESGKASSLVARKFKCELCGKGRHQPDEGTTSCLKCIPGQYQTETGQQNCNACEIGRASPAVARTTDCEICTIGRKQPRTGTTACLDCIPGKYQDQPEQVNCIDCQKNTYTRAAQQVVCKICATGKYSVRKGSASCASCGAGRFGIGCNKCPTGYYRVADDPNLARCMICDTGENTNNKTGAASCSGCDLGRYGSSKGTCTDCPTATFQDERKQLSCKTCKGGKIPNQKQTSCEYPDWKIPQDCEPETQYLNDTGQNTSMWKCLPCPDGGHCAYHGTISQVRARAGYWRVPWSEHNITFIRCPYFLDCQGVTDGQKRKSEDTSTNSTFIEGCKFGTRGPLCSLCIDGYNRDLNECTVCVNGSVPARIALLVVVVLLLFVLFSQCRKRIQNTWKKYQPLWRDALRVVAINVTFAQINYSMPSVIEVHWPVEWTTFLKYFSFVNIGKFIFMYCVLC